jgi:aspartyl-tRNA synthetase
MPLRSHTCGELTAKSEGSKVTLCGWVENKRNHGGVLFIDIRDRYGHTQVVFNPKDDQTLYEQASRLSGETVIKVEGTVGKRPEGMANPDMHTGEIEVRCESLTVLSKAETPPFELHEADSVGDLKRMKYRYIDMRRQRITNNLVFRHHIFKGIRDYYSENGFIEVETPFLTKSTPEGARDYLVPSRTYPGRFYALPQSPQMFKQLLMVGGMDKYFQIVKCFRDEDLRADRQPEFTQLDVEMSFVTEEDIHELLEGMVAQLMEKVVGHPVKPPFPRMSYAEALDRYGSDKPDTRFGMDLVDLTDIAAKCEFKVFRSVVENGGLVRGICAAKQFSRKEIDGLTDYVKEYGAKGLAWFKAENGILTSSIAKFFKPEELSEIVFRFAAKDGDTIFIVADSRKTCLAALGELRVHLGGLLGLRDDSKYNYLWVTEPPLFELDDDARLTSTHHPFTSPNEEDLGLLENEPLKVRSRAYDLVLNGVELGSGSVRIHDSEVQSKVFTALGISREQAQARFGFFLEALRYGTPPHAGIALGLDRMTALLAGEESIREVMAFPKTTSAACPLTDSPSEIDKAQLDELKIQLKEKD